MKISVNGELTETAAGTLAELAKEFALPGSGVAVAVNGRVVPRAEWTAFPLREDAAVVIVKAACGG